MSQDPNCEKYYYSIFGRLGQIITTIVRAQRVYAKLFPVATSTTETAAKLDRVKASAKWDGFPVAERIIEFPVDPLLRGMSFTALYSHSRESIRRWTGDVASR